MKIAVNINIDWPLKRYHKVYAGIEAYAQEKLDWIICWDLYPEVQLEKDFGYYAGIIGRCNVDTINAAKKLNIPVINTWHTNRHLNKFSVLPDYFIAGKMAAEAMVKKGFENFASINFGNGSAAQMIVDGVSSVLKLKKHAHQILCFDIDMEDSRQKWEKARNSFDQWITTWEFPLAVIVGNDGLAPKIAAFCHENAIRIPEDITLISMENDQGYCEGFTPKITSVDIDYFKIGYEAAKMLDKTINKQAVIDEMYLIPPSGIKYRESTNHVVIKDDVIKQAINFIAENFNKNIKVDDVVNLFPISRSSLMQRFKNSVGHSIHDEIARQRIETMKLLLIQSNDSIKVLSHKAGYSSDILMRRSFKLATGMLPKEYRNYHLSK